MGEGSHRTGIVWFQIWGAPEHAIPRRCGSGPKWWAGLQQRRSCGVWELLAIMSIAAAKKQDEPMAKGAG